MLGVVGWVVKPNGFYGCGGCWVFNPTYGVAVIFILARPITLVLAKLAAFFFRRPIGFVRFNNPYGIFTSPNTALRVFPCYFGQSFVIKRKQRFVIDQHVLLARFVFEFGNFLNQLFVVDKKFRLQIAFLRHQRAADKDFTRFFGGDSAVGHGAARQNGQAVERYPFAGDDFAAFLFPVRLEIVVADEVRRFLLDPFGLDGGHIAGIKFCRFNEFCRHYPFGFGFEQGGGGEKVEAAAARAGVVVAVGRFHADVGDEAGEQGAVDLFVARFFGSADLGAVLLLI